jgi:hypothetical protein
MIVKKELVVFQIKKSKKQKPSLQLVSREDIRWYNVLFRSIGKNKITNYVLEDDTIIKELKRFDVVVVSYQDKENIVSVEKKVHSLAEYVDEEQEARRQDEKRDQEKKNLPKPDRMEIKMPAFVAESPFADELGNDAGSSDNVVQDKKGGVL